MTASEPSFVEQEGREENEACSKAKGLFVLLPSTVVGSHLLLDLNRPTAQGRILGNRVFANKALALFHIERIGA
jgi:hypothetical protein